MSATDQTEVISFLASGAAHGCSAGEVRCVETHGALVFLGADDVYKIKRAVRFSYMDLTTLEARRRLCAREHELNAPQAPELYLGVVAVTRGPGGALVLGGEGPIVEWALHMRRFADEDLLSRRVDSGALDTRLAIEVCDAVVEHHRVAEVRSGIDPGARMRLVLAGLAEGLSAPELMFDKVCVVGLIEDCRLWLDRAGPVLVARSRGGCVRRCHGDLHLENIVLWRGRPVLFDALEFDEELATVDTLYDLAFLLMDLDARGRRDAANVVLNRYLWRSGEAIDIDGLVAMPLFLAARAAVRAMVLAQRAALRQDATDAVTRRRAETYFRSALGYVSPRAPRLLAIGGMSGTGKSTLAASLAPDLGPAPGAVLLRSDLERKALLGVGETDRLPDSGYSQDINRRVYDRLMERARAALSAGYAVIVDAAFLHEEERRAVGRLASAAAVPFDGLWLTAPADVLAARIAGRVGDASDATVEVLRKQLAWKPDATEWSRIDASGDAESTLRGARAALSTWQCG
jgi:aminoglycoside phosphotransferase family enzyme/predicted kinase